jgi:hypothetical protein
VAEQVVETFRPTSGRVTGTLALLMVVVIVVIGLWPGEHGVASYVVWGALFAGVLTWASMLRPRLWATESRLVMRNMLSTISIPLAAIEEVAVRQVCAVRAGDRRYVSPAVGKTFRQIRPDRSQREGSTPDTMPYAVFVEVRIHDLAERARTQAGIALLSDEQVALAADVRRQWAWPEVVALAITFVGLVVAIVLSA